MKLIKIETPLEIESQSIPQNNKSPEAKHLKNGFLDNSEKLRLSEYLGKFEIDQHMKVLTDQASKSFFFKPCIW
jgi:hypothetical protein